MTLVNCYSGRATSAAPLWVGFYLCHLNLTKSARYFKSFHGYHDGALGGHNNPIMLAKWEQDFIWSRSKKEPDIVLSLGTGFKANAPQETENRSPLGKIFCAFQDTFIPRLSRSFMVLLEAEKKHREHRNSLNPTALSRYYRMNIEFHETEPPLDNVRAIPDMVAHVQSFADTNREKLRRCANNMVASLFYVELVRKPIPNEDETVFICQLRIRCRLSPSQLALIALLQQLQDTQAYFCYDNQKSIACVDSQLYDDVKGGAAFSRRIDIIVSSLDDMLDIKLDDMFRRGEQSISNCPYHLNTLIRDQGLHCIFGHKDHKRRFQAEAEYTTKRPRCW